MLVKVAVASRLARFASPLIHDVGGVLEGFEEEEFSVLQETLCALLPSLVAFHEVEHEGRAVKKHGVIVRPLCLVADLFAVRLVVGAVEDLVNIRDKTNLLCPVINLDCPVGVSLVASVASKACAERKGGSVRDRVLVVVAVGILGIDLPLQSTST